MKVTVIGCGKMGGGIAERLAMGHKPSLFDNNKERTETFAKRIGAKNCLTTTDAIKNSEVIIIAVKPRSLEKLAKALSNDLTSNQLIVSCLAGTTVETLQSHFPNNPCLRIMPNLPVIYGVGVVGIVDKENLSSEYKEKVNHLFSSLGYLHWVPESKIDAISSLTGSGPAFISVIIESMIDAGVSMGLDSTLSKELALQLLSGTASTLEQSQKHPAEFKLEVASPGGTTITGLKTMEDLSLRSAMINTFLATYQHNQRLSNKKDN